jgi:hypothetical protein
MMRTTKKCENVMMRSEIVEQKTHSHISNLCKCREYFVLCTF